MSLTYSKEFIIQEYNQSAEHREEFRKVKWGSPQSMMNRFYLAMKELPFAKAPNWFDIGCGTGAFQSVVKHKFPHIHGLGVDLNTKLIGHALSKQIQGIEFRVADFMEVKNVEFDLITCLGVIQKANFSLSQFFKHVAVLLHPKGKLLVDTKYIGWKKFKDPKIIPEPIHQWFSIQQLRHALHASGLQEVKLSGFLPAENKLVEPEDSHTIFLIAQKP